MMKHARLNRSQAGILCTLVLAGASILLGGCSKAMAPTFAAMGVREVEHHEDRSVIEFSIQATNPNKEPIPLKQIRYRVEIDGVEVFSGVRSPQTTLHTYSSHVFKLPAVIPASALSGSESVSYLVVGTAQYVPPGRLSEVLFDAEVKVPEAVIELSGTINTGN